MGDTLALEEGHRPLVPLPAPSAKVCPPRKSQRSGLLNGRDENCGIAMVPGRTLRLKTLRSIAEAQPGAAEARLKRSRATTFHFVV